MPAAVPQVMLCLIKLMKHRVICSLLLHWRQSTLHGNQLFASFFAVLPTALSFEALTQSDIRESTGRAAALSPRSRVTCCGTAVVQYHLVTLFAALMFYAGVERFGIFWCMTCVFQHVSTETTHS